MQKLALRGTIKFEGELTESCLFLTLNDPAKLSRLRSEVSPKFISDRSISALDSVTESKILRAYSRRELTGSGEIFINTIS